MAVSVAAKTAEKKPGKSAAKTAVKPAVKPSLAPKKWAGNVPQIRPGTYADGIPFHELQYLACKLILRPNHFTSRKSLFDFADVMQGPAAQFPPARFHRQQMVALATFNC
jgi:hypothetical protein